MDFSVERPRRSVLINVTSLIDVMFLLVLFFLISSTFKQQAAINLVLPRSTTAEATALTPSVVYLTAAGEIYLDKEPLDRDILRERLRRLQAGTGEDRLVLTADEGAAHGTVVSLIDLIKECGFTRVSLSVREP